MADLVVREVAGEVADYTADLVIRKAKFTKSARFTEHGKLENMRIVRYIMQK